MHNSAARSEPAIGNRRPGAPIRTTPSGAETKSRSRIDSRAWAREEAVPDASQRRCPRNIVVIATLIICHHVRVERGHVRTEV